MNLHLSLEHFILIKLPENLMKTYRTTEMKNVKHSDKNDRKWKQEGMKS